MKAGLFCNFALGQQCAWAVPGDFSVPERDDTIHCWGLDRIDSVDVASKRVFIRVDFNAPHDKKDPSVITNTQRIDAALPTIQYRLDQGCTSVVLASHFGRPDGRTAEKYSLAPVAKCLEDELKRPVTILKGCAGSSVEAACANPSPGSVILLENVRFHVEEEEKGVDKDGNKFKADAEAVKVFRSSFAKLDDAFCSDAFGTAHRAHSSMMGDGFPVECSGFLVAKELDAFAKVLDKAAGNLGRCEGERQDSAHQEHVL